MKELSPVGGGRMRNATTTKNRNRALWFANRERALGCAQLIFELVNQDTLVTTDVRIKLADPVDDMYLIELEVEGSGEVEYLEDPEEF